VPAIVLPNCIRCTYHTVKVKSKAVPFLRHGRI